MAVHPTLVHVLPLMTSSATFALAIFQYPTYGPFLTAKPSIAGQPFSAYWQAQINLALPCIVVPLVITTLSGFIAAQSLHGSAAASWYTYGAISALGHFAFVPFVAPRIREMAARKDEKPIAKLNAAEEANRDAANRYSQKTWFTVHLVRSLTVDIAAVWCFYKGLTGAFA